VRGHSIVGGHFELQGKHALFAGVGRETFAARFADYKAKQFATDTRKFWLSVDWAL